MKMDSGKQPNRYWYGHVKYINTLNLPVQMQIKRDHVDERICKVANKRTKEFSATHNVEKSEHNTVDRNTYTVADKQINTVIGKFHAPSLRKYFQH